ncbi:MAG: D-ribose pyranase [Bacteroidota bacterium]
MKKGVLLNSEISAVVAKMGHTDLLAITDCGLPIPDEIKRIDIALTKDVPGFVATLKVVLTELKVEEVIIAKEMEAENPQIHQVIQEIFKGIKISKVSHEEFKVLTKRTRACIRTGECTPYANIILKSGVTF